MREGIVVVRIPQGASLWFLATTDDVGVPLEESKFWVAADRKDPVTGIYGEHCTFRWHTTMYFVDTPRDEVKNWQKHAKM